MYPGYNMIINTILVFYAIKKLDADSSKQVRIYIRISYSAVAISDQHTANKQANNINGAAFFPNDHNLAEDRDIEDGIDEVYEKSLNPRASQRKRQDGPDAVGADHGEGERLGAELPRQGGF